jgi:hypothetical protein
MTSSGTHKIELLATDAVGLETLFGGRAPTVGSHLDLGDGVTLKVVDTRTQRGVIESSVLVNFALQVVSGVAVKVVGELLSERFKGQKGSLKVDGAVVPIDDPKAIGAALTSGR